MDSLIVTSSPHINSGETTSRVMYDVIIALVPAMIASYLFFGLRALLLLAVAVGTAVVFEAGVQWLRRRPITIFDGSAAITGILLVFNVSSELPLWLVVLGSAVAILIGKQAFGGLGHNIFNPALIGRAFLLAAYPTAMTSWAPPRFAQLHLDGATYATPLGIIKEKLSESLPSYLDMFLGNIGGSLGETSVLALLLGGAFLLYRRVITWHIPVSYIATVFLLTWIMGRDPLFNILAGGLMIGAIFMATDMVTSPISTKGMLIFGIGCGLVTVAIRLFGQYPEGVCYSILFMNACTPLIDRYTAPRRFGAK